MKKYKLFFVGIIFSIFGFSQNSYYDAIQLRAIDHTMSNGVITLNSKSENFDLLNSILSRYIVEKDAISSDTELIVFPKITVAFRDNPFLKISIKSKDNEVFNFKRSPLGSSSLSSIGGLDITNFADGLARFLIKRGKQELNIAFFQRMKDFLDQNIEAQTLFPATSAFLSKIDAYRYSEFLQSLREAFYKDISNIIVNLNILIDLPQYEKLLKALPEIRLAVRSAKIISGLSQLDSSMHPANVISHFAKLEEWGEMNKNLKNSWRILDIISESVRRMDSVQAPINTIRILNKDSFITKITYLSDNISEIDKIKIDSGTSLKISTSQMQLRTSKEVAWINFSDFNENILNDSITLKIYLGLLYQKMHNISFRTTGGKEISVQQFMNDNANNIFKLSDLIENFLFLANDVEQSIKDIKSKKSNGPTNDDYNTYIEKAINVIDYGFKVANIIDEKISADEYIVMARNANSLYKNIYTKNYNAAIMNAYIILQEVLLKSKEALVSKNSVFETSGNKIDSLQIASFMNAKTSIDTATFYGKDSMKIRLLIVENILKYGNLIASIVKAETPEEAESAIEAAVLPAGSSSIKKNSSWNISLNAYIGGYITNSLNNTDKIDGNSSNVGVTAPIGIAFSKGLGKYNNGSTIGSISLFASLIDVGAIAGYRLNDDSTALVQKVTLGEIFTPGAYLVYGIGLPFKFWSYVPLSVGYGWQYGSKLFYRTDVGTLDVSEKSRWRSNWFIAIDIPLVNFWTKHRIKRN